MEPGPVAPRSDRSPFRSRDLLLVAIPIQAAFLWLYYYPAPRGLLGDETRYLDEALRIAQGLGYDPTFVWPPLQSYLIGTLFRLFGPSLITLQLLQIGLLWGGGLLFREVARKVGVSRAASDLCLLAYICYPDLVAFSHFLWPETTHLFLLVLAAYWLMDGRNLPSLGAGVAAGVALLLKSLLLPFLPLLVAVAAWPRQKRRWRPIPALLVVAGLALPTLPVAVGNGVRYGYWGIASSGWFNVWVGLNDRSPRNLVDSIVAREMKDYLASSDDPRTRERLIRERIGQKIARDGLGTILLVQLGKQYARLMDKDSFFTDQLPGGVEQRYAGISPSATWQLRTITYVLWFLVLVTAIPGMSVPLPEGMRRRMLPFALFLAGNLLMFLLLHVKTRYRIPLMPVLFLYTAILWDFVAGNIRGRWGIRRQAPAFAASVLVLWLAFVA